MTIRSKAWGEKTVECPAGPAELRAARDWGAHLVPAHEIHAGGVEAALARIPEGAQVVVSFDLDALDPSVMPAVIAPTGGGLTHAQILALLRGLAARARIRGLAMVEFKPDADRDGIGARTAAQLLATGLGLIARQVAETR